MGAMWFLGLIIGAIGGGFDAIVGAAVGWALSEKQKSRGDGRLAALEASVRHLQAIGGRDE